MVKIASLFSKKGKKLLRESSENIRYNLNRGIIEMMVLDLVLIKNRTQLEVIKILTADGSVSDKTIYAIFFRLSEEGYFSTVKDEYKGKIYSITPKGIVLANEYELEYSIMEDKIKCIKEEKHGKIRK